MVCAWMRTSCQPLAPDAARSSIATSRHPVHRQRAASSAKVVPAQRCWSETIAPHCCAPFVMHLAVSSGSLSSFPVRWRASVLAVSFVPCFSKVSEHLSIEPIAASCSVISCWTGHEGERAPQNSALFEVSHIGNGIPFFEHFLTAAAYFLAHFSAFFDVRSAAVQSSPRLSESVKRRTMSGTRMSEVEKAAVLAEHDRDRLCIASPPSGLVKPDDTTLVGQSTEWGERTKVAAITAGSRGNRCGNAGPRGLSAHPTVTRR